MSFRPSVLPTLAAIIVVVVTARLGVWQLDRHAQAQARMANIDTQLSAPPLGPEAFQEVGGVDVDHRRVELPGRYLDQPPFLVPGQLGSEPGYRVIAPFQSTDGVVLLVNRGWIPAMDWERHLAAIWTDGRIQVRGVVRRIEGSVGVEPLVASDGRPERWPMETEPFLGVLSKAVGPPYASLRARIPAAVPFLVIEGPQLKDEGHRTASSLPANGFVVWRSTVSHLAYAGQWFAISGIAAIFWIVFGIRRARQQLAADGAAS